MCFRNHLTGRCFFDSGVLVTWNWDRLQSPDVSLSSVARMSVEEICLAERESRW